jgi:hypothetical protein
MRPTRTAQGRLPAILLNNRRYTDAPKASGWRNLTLRK